MLQSSHIQSDYIPYPFVIVTNLFSLIKNDEISIDLPPYLSFNKLENHIVFSKVALKENDMPYLERSVVLTADTIQARIMHRVVDIMKSVTTVYDLEDYLRRLDGKKICSIKSTNCRLLIPINKNKCRNCIQIKYKRKVKAKKWPISKKIKMNKQIYMRKRKNQLESIVVNIKKELIDSKKIDEFIKDLPVTQQQMIKTCCMSSQCKKKEIDTLSTGYIPVY